MSDESLSEKLNCLYSNIVNYEGSRESFKPNLRKTLIGGAAIIGLNLLNAPDLVEIVAYAYTAYNGFKTIKDYKQL